MNWPSTPAGVSPPRSPLEAGAGAVRKLLRTRANVLLVHVHQAFARRRERGRDGLAEMNAHMLRDLGIEGAQVSRAPERRDLQFPRL